MNDDWQEFIEMMKKAGWKFTPPEREYAPGHIKNNGVTHWTFLDTGKELAFGNWREWHATGQTPPPF